MKIKAYLHVVFLSTVHVIFTMTLLQHAQHKVSIGGVYTVAILLICYYAYVVNKVSKLEKDSNE